jgi:hypothetical protein
MTRLRDSASAGKASSAWKDDLAGGGAVLAHDPHDAVARLRKRGEGLERLEGGGQATPVTLIRPADVAGG